MGYKYSVWIVPNSHKYIKTHYNMSHTPHVTIKTFLSLQEATELIDTLKSHYYINYQENIYDFNMKYSKDDILGASGFYCSIRDLKLEHTPHMTIHYCTHNKVIHIKPPTDSLGTVYVANTVSNNPSEWYII